MKKFITFLCVLALLLSISSCGLSNSKLEEKPQDPPAPKIVEPTSLPDTDEKENDADQVELPDQTEAQPDQTKSQPDQEKPVTAPVENSDVSSAVDASLYTKTDPIPLGQWAKVARYSPTDKTYHNVCVRVTKITRQADDDAYVQSAIALHNENASDWRQIDISELKLPSDVELYVLDYEVFVPADFPSETWGINPPEISFSQGNINGGGIPNADGTATYIGLSTSICDLETGDIDYMPGNTYSFRILMPMVKGFSDFVLDTSTYPDGTPSDDSSGNSYYAYFAIK